METSVAKQLLEIIEEETCTQNVTPDMTFEQLGMDSLDFICLINAICEKVGAITRAEAIKLKTVGDILAVFEK